MSYQINFVQRNCFDTGGVLRGVRGPGSVSCQIGRRYQRLSYVRNMNMSGTSGMANFNKSGHRAAAACHANFACCGQPPQNFLASPQKSVVSPSRLLPLPGLGENTPTEHLTYILDCDLTYTAPSGDRSFVGLTRDFLPQPC
jgi:hypothetical protein